MRNHLSDARIAEYIESLTFNRVFEARDGELEHLEKCNLCREKILDVSLFFAEEGSKEIGSDEKLMESYMYETLSRYNRKKRSYYKAFSRVAAVIVVTFGLYYSSLFLPELSLNKDVAKVPPVIRAGITLDKTVSNSNKSVKKKARKKAVKVKKPNNFTANRNLERMVGNVYRSGSIKILTPSNSSSFPSSKDIEFKWSGIKPHNHSLKIVNNRNETVYEFNVQDNWVRLDLKLSSGLYYWKLENETDLLYVGRFQIK